MKPRDRLRIATQKSGRLSQPGRELLTRSGLSFRESRDRLFCYGEALPIDLLLVRDDDIPGLIAEGTCDLGFVGRNVLEELRLGEIRAGRVPAFAELRALGFGQCRLSLALPQEQAWHVRELQPASADQNARSCAPGPTCPTGGEMFPPFCAAAASQAPSLRFHNR